MYLDETPLIVLLIAAPSMLPSLASVRMCSSSSRPELIITWLVLGAHTIERTWPRPCPEELSVLSS